MVVLRRSKQSLRLLDSASCLLLKHTGPTRLISTSIQTPQAPTWRKSQSIQASKLEYSRWRREFSNRSSYNASNDGDGNVPGHKVEQSSNAPHKEYFQNPGQAPKPDLSPYARSTPRQSSKSFTAPPPSYLQHHPDAVRQDERQSSHKTYFQDSPGNKSQPDSFARRFLRSSFHTILFVSLGSVAGTALITWEYMSPMLEEGSEEEAEMVEDIFDTLEDHGLIFGLREDGWREVDLSSPNVATAANNVKSLADFSSGSTSVDASNQLSGTTGSRDGREVQGRAEGVGMGRSMLYQVLTGSKGLVGMKMFHHPSQDYSVMVFFTGFGIEGWPDVVHGGIVTSLIEEAVQKHIDWFHQGQFEKVVDVGVKIDFKKPVQPGEIYAVLVPPALVEPVSGQNNLGIMHGSVPSGFSRIKVVGLFMQLDGAPKVSTGISRQMGASAVEHQIEVPGRNQQGPDIHAVGEITLKVVAGRNAGTQHQDLLDSIAKSNASFSGGYGRSEDSGDV